MYGTEATSADMYPESASALSGAYADADLTTETAAPAGEAVDELTDDLTAEIPAVIDDPEPYQASDALTSSRYEPTSSRYVPANTYPEAKSQAEPHPQPTPS
ncbi:hypothetical protein, partial [Kribbella solani]|uniref:hypothetical protein n=1 Tax=Kribbella solani TaxID=236067 RepID=UPI0029BD78E5